MLSKSVPSPSLQIVQTPEKGFNSEDGVHYSAGSVSLADARFTVSYAHLITEERKWQGSDSIPLQGERIRSLSIAVHAHPRLPRIEMSIRARNEKGIPAHCLEPLSELVVDPAPSAPEGITIYSKEKGKALAEVLELLPKDSTTLRSDSASSPASLRRVLVAHLENAERLQAYERGVPARLLLPENLLQLIEDARDLSPLVIRKRARSLTISEALIASNELKNTGVDFPPYEFSRVPRIWDTYDTEGVVYRVKGTELLLQEVARRYDSADITSASGFQDITSRVTRNVFISTPVGQTQFTLDTMLGSSYKQSPVRAFLELVECHPAFAPVKALGIKPYDFSGVPKSTWSLGEKHTPTATEVVRLALNKVAEEEGIKNWKTRAGFDRLLPFISLRRLASTVISRLGTTAHQALTRGFNDNLAKALEAVIAATPSLAKLGGVVFDPNLLPRAPRGVLSQAAVPTTVALERVAAWIISVGQQLQANPYTPSGMGMILNQLRANQLRKAGANRRKRNGTSLESRGTRMIARKAHRVVADLYKGSVSRAVVNVVNTLKPFSAIKHAGLSEGDFPIVPRNYWCTPRGQATDMARAVALNVAQAVARRWGIEIDSPQNALIVCRQMLIPFTYRRAINDFGTTGRRVLRNAYNENPRLVVQHLLTAPEFHPYRDYVLQNLEGSLNQRGEGSREVAQ